MAIAVDNTPANVKPLEGATILRYVAGSAISPGSPVCISSDGYIDEADASAVATNNVCGIALAPRNQGTAFAACDAVDVVTEGRVQCVTGGTPGAFAYTSDTTGDIAETTGTKTTIIGRVETATVINMHIIVVSLS